MANRFKFNPKQSENGDGLDSINTDWSHTAKRINRTNTHETKQCRELSLSVIHHPDFW